MSQLSPCPRQVAAAVPLTRMQRKLLEFIRAFILTHGVSPTFAEMGAALSLSKGNVHTHIRNLVQRGAVTSRRNAARSIAIVGGNAITITLAVDLDCRMRALARQSGVTIEALVIECVRDGLSRCSILDSRETRAAPDTNVQIAAEHRGPGCEHQRGGHQGVG
jgi:SOS-response transcriptional repressor LexA